ncbi:cell division protein FtsQ/DivIB [Portibacter marinus]|uniref:cell division protein FtsQ/DivIB n=1 Tax=Portibacter marinus TaxID=2898660 RepID=UPI001F33A640|nr:hypothetical protein [Portibacter marinus]
MIKNIKKYISENRFLKVSLILFSIVSFVVVSRLAIQEKKQMGVRAFHVSIAYKDKTKKLINSEYVKNEVRKSIGYNVERVNIEQLDVAEIERILKNNHFIGEVDVFMDGRNILRTVLKQKNPIVRISDGKEGYYLDEDGDFVPLSPIATVRVPVITGNVNKYSHDYKKDENHQFNAIFKLARRVNEDEFLEALTEQIHVKKDGSYLLVPKLGNEKILLGSVDDLDEKVFKLKQFYKEGLTREGWGKYALLDFQYDEIVRTVRN